jgi:uncharacterized membrane protein YfcA
MIVIFLATFIRSAFGFGEALLAVPLLALRVAVDIAVPLAVLVSVTVAAVIVAQDWRMIHFRSAGWLLLSTVAGIPAGLALLIAVDERIVKGILAAIITAFAVYSLFGRSRFELKNDNRLWLLGCGFSAGVLGGAYGMNGPPLVVYGSLRRWPAQPFRATLQAYFLPASLLALAGYAAAGLLTAPVARYGLLTLPRALAALFLGRTINRRLRGPAFLRYVHAGLIAIAVTLLIQTWRR